ncbi:hypothetical protein GG344DRAFT_69862 [Lentinula edodes]|nr:hypothetical protein GG344DRAFT_69862 [Lentinula edodes]
MLLYYLEEGVAVAPSEQNKFKVCLHIKNAQFRGRIDPNRPCKRGRWEEKREAVELIGCRREYTSGYTRPIKWQGLMRFLCADTIQSRRVPEVIKGGAKKGQKSLTAGRHFPRGISKIQYQPRSGVLPIHNCPRISCVRSSRSYFESSVSFIQNPTASSSTAENTHDSSRMTKTDIMNAMKAQKIDIVFQYPEKNRPGIVSRSLQANVQRGSFLLVKAAMETLGIDIKPSFNIKYSGFVSKPRSIEYRFKVWFLKKEDGGGGMDKLIELTGFLKMRLNDKKVEEKEVGEKEVKEADQLVFYGRVIDSKGEPIVTLNHKGKIVPKKRPGPLNDDEPGVSDEAKDGGQKQKGAGKKVQWADPESVDITVPL